MEMRPVIKFGLSEITEKCILENIIYEFQVVLSTGVKIFGVLWNCHEKDSEGYGILGYALFLERNDGVLNPVTQLISIGEGKDNGGFFTGKVAGKIRKNRYNSRRLLREIFQIIWLSNAYFRMSQKENYEYHTAIDLYSAGFRVKNMTVIHRHNFSFDKYYMMNVVMYVNANTPRLLMKNNSIRPLYFGNEIIPWAEGDLSARFSNIAHLTHSYRQYLKDTEIPDLHKAAVEYTIAYHKNKNQNNQTNQTRHDARR